MSDLQILPTSKSRNLKNKILSILDNNRTTLRVAKAMDLFTLNALLNNDLDSAKKAMVLFDYDLTTVLIEELQKDGFVTLMPITQKSLSKSYFITITPRGAVYVSNGGYSSPSLFVAIKRYIIKNTIAVIIGTIGAIGMGLLIAYLTHYFGWN